MSSNILHNMQINEDEAGETEDFINYSLPPWIYVFKSFFLGGHSSDKNHSNLFNHWNHSAYYFKLSFVETSSNSKHWY